MSRLRNKKWRYKLAAVMSSDSDIPTATLEVEEDENAEPLLIKGVNLSDNLSDNAASTNNLYPLDDSQILFIPITKVDAVKREVWGRAAQEVRDHADEIMDYASSKPLFNAWVEDAYKRSGGKSKGNIRAMHGPIAAGKVIDFMSSDAEKAFDIGTKIVDDNEWQKCAEGVYTGFSIGGKYAKRWYDNGLTRYTAEPHEISLVDTPAIPTATFKMIKEDGTEELRKFAPSAPAGNKQTIVETPVVMMPALSTPLQVNALDASNDPNLASQKFVDANNPNIKPIDPGSTPAVVPNAQGSSAPPVITKKTAMLDAVRAGRLSMGHLGMTFEKDELERIASAMDADDIETYQRELSSAIRHAREKINQEEGVQKAVQDIPNLRHIKESDLTSCGNCLHFRTFGFDNPPYCRKFDSCVRWDWVCDAWQKAEGDPDQTLIPLAETGTPSPSPVEQVALAKPASEPVIDKADNPKGEPDEEEKKLIAVGQRVGIARREGSPKTPPKGYPTELSQYADPANYAFPVDQKRAVTAVGYYNAGGEKLKAYNPREKAVLGRRIARMAGAVLGTRYKFDPKSKQITRIEDKREKTPYVKETKKMDISQMLQQMRGLLDTDTDEARDQAKAMLDVAIDTVSTPSSIDPQPAAQATTVPATKAGDPASPPSSPSSPSPDSKTPQTSVPTSATTPAAAAKVEGAVMNDPIASTQPVAPFNIGIGGESFIKARMPEFVGVMERTDDTRRLNKAFETICQKDQYAFDELWNYSCYELAKQAGFSSRNKDELFRMGPTTFGGGISGRGESVELAKAFNATTAPGVYLRRLLALMIPVMNPWRMRVNTSMPTTGSDKAIWRMILGFQATVLAMAMRSTEAGTSIGSTTGSGVPVDETPASFTASYQSIKLNNAVTGKSLYTMRGYDDPVTVALLETLTGTLRVEEMQNIIGNFAAVAKPASVTCTPSTAAGAVPASNYIVRVTSLTGQGWRLTQEISSYIGGGTYTINGSSQATVGESDPRAATVQTLSSTGQLIVTWPSVPGAAAYNVYVRDDTGATEHWYATVTAPKITITSYPSTGNSGAAIPDTTANTLGFEGVLPWSVLSTVYTTSIPQKSSVVVDSAGSALTLVAPNSISELDTVIGGLFTKWHIAPTLLLMSPNTTNHVTAKVGSATNPPQLIVIQQGPAQGQVIGGLAATGYINRFSPWLSGAPSVIPILAHPYYPDGNISVVCESIPYPNAREGRGYTLETLRPYTYWPIAPLTDAIPFMIVADELLECNHPSAQGQVYGIDVS